MTAEGIIKTTAEGIFKQQLNEFTNGCSETSYRRQRLQRINQPVRFQNSAQLFAVH